MCKMLDAQTICYGKIAKKYGQDVIYAENELGIRRPIFWSNHKKNRYGIRLAIHGNTKKDDMQKAIVIRILKALEHGNVWIESFRFSYGDSYEICIPQNTCFEQKIIEMDLA